MNAAVTFAVVVLAGCSGSSLDKEMQARADCEAKGWTWVIATGWTGCIKDAERYTGQERKAK